MGQANCPLLPTCNEFNDITHYVNNMCGQVLSMLFNFIGTYTQWAVYALGKGQYHNLIAELYQEDQPAFSNFMQRQTTFFRKSLTPGLRIARTSGQRKSYIFLWHSFRKMCSIINGNVPGVCDQALQSIR